MKEIENYDDWIDVYYEYRNDEINEVPFMFNDKIYILNWENIHSAFYDFGHDTSLKDIGDKTDYLIEISLEDALIKLEKINNMVIFEDQNFIQPNIEDVLLDVLSKIKYLSNLEYCQSAGDMQNRLADINDLIIDLLPDLKEKST